MYFLYLCIDLSIYRSIYLCIYISIYLNIYLNNLQGHTTQSFLGVLWSTLRCIYIFSTQSSLGALKHPFKHPLKHPGIFQSPCHFPLTPLPPPHLLRLLSTSCWSTNTCARSCAATLLRRVTSRCMRANTRTAQCTAHTTNNNAGPNRHRLT